MQARERKGTAKPLRENPARNQVTCQGPQVRKLARGMGLDAACASHVVERERERERARERERERESVAILAQVSHLCLGACDASLHRGGGAGLPRGCALEGAPVAFPGGA